MAAKSDSKSGNYRYVLHGRVLPERGQTKTPTVMWEDEDANIQIGIYSSQVMAVAEFDEEIHIHTLKNWVTSMASSHVDVYAFATGRAFNVEITAGIQPNGKMVVFGESIPTHEKRIPEDDVGDFVNSVIDLYGMPNGEYLMLCLSDFKRAIQNPEDTGFHCFRSIESIRQYFKYEFDLADGSPTWEKLRNELGFEREHIDFIQEYQGDRRHGDVRWITEQERGEITERAWDVIDAFIKYLEENSGS